MYSHSDTKSSYKTKAKTKDTTDLTTEGRKNKGQCRTSQATQTFLNISYQNKDAVFNPIYLRQTKSNAK